MSEGFHVHGAHDHEVDHAAEHGPGLGQQVAIFTALLATVGAVVSFLGGSAQNEALFHKNGAVLYKAHASDQWSFYQAKSTKGHIMGMASELAPKDKQSHYRDEAARYDKEKAEIKAKAEALEEKSGHDLYSSGYCVGIHYRIDQAPLVIGARCVGCCNRYYAVCMGLFVTFGLPQYIGHIDVTI